MVIAAVKSAYWTVSRPKAEAGGDGQDQRRSRRRRRASASASSGGDDQPEHGADRAQDQALVGLVAVGAQHEEDRQRDPEAVVVHVEEPVDGDAGGQRGAEAERVAGGCRSQGQVRAQGRERGARCPSLLGSLARRGRPTTQTSSDQSDLGGRRRWRRAAPAARRDRRGRGPGRSAAPAPPRGRRSPAAASTEKQ